MKPPRKIVCDGSCAEEACGTFTKTVTVEEAARLAKLAEERGLTVEFAEEYPGHPEHPALRTCTSTPCPFFSEGRCSVYADRPMICRTWFCDRCGTLTERRMHGREIFIRERSKENGWIRFTPPVYDGDVLPG